MIEYSEVPGTNIVELTVDGTIGKGEFDGLVANLEGAIREHGKVRVLEQIRSFGGMPPSKYWDDFRFGLRHLGDISHAAVVADATWIEALTKLMNPFLSAEVRHFDLAEVDAAREWLRSAS